MKALFKFCLLPVFLLTLLVAGVIYVIVTHLSFDELIKSLFSSEVLFALELSFMTSLGATGLAVLLGLPTGYFLARHDFYGKTILDTLLDIPLVMTPLVAGVGLLFLLGQSHLGRPLSRLGLNFVFSPWGVVMAQAFIAIPILTRSSKSAIEEVNPRYEWAAQTLGLTPLATFFRVTLPMARQGILTGIVLAWARAVGEFGATLMLAGATRMKTETLPIAVYLNMSSGEMGTALSCAVVLIVVGFISLLVIKWIGKGLGPELSPKGRS